MQCGPFKQTTSPEPHLREQAERLRQEAQGTPPDAARDKLIRQACRMEASSHVQDFWPTSVTVRMNNSCACESQADFQDVQFWLAARQPPRWPELHNFCSPRERPVEFSLSDRKGSVMIALEEQIELLELGASDAELLSLLAHDPETRALNRVVADRFLSLARRVAKQATSSGGMGPPQLAAFSFRRLAG